MNGPAHYREAESLVRRSSEVDTEWGLLLAAQAQVHATLALVAATCQPVMRQRRYPTDADPWDGVLS